MGLPPKQTRIFKYKDREFTMTAELMIKPMPMGLSDIVRDTKPCFLLNIFHHGVAWNDSKITQITSLEKELIKLEESAKIWVDDGTDVAELKEAEKILLKFGFK